MKNTISNTQSILDDMRKITILTGEISSVHEKSLLQWPYILFDNIENVKITYDLTKNSFQNYGQNLVEFYLSKTQEDTIPEEEFKKRCDILKGWTEDMFWSNIEVRVHVNETLRFESNPKLNDELKPTINNQE